MRVPITTAGTLSFPGPAKGRPFIIRRLVSGDLQRTTNTTAGGGLNEIRSLDDVCTRIGVVMRAASNRGRGEVTLSKTERPSFGPGVYYFFAETRKLREQRKTKSKSPALSFRSRSKERDGGSTKS